VRGRRIYRGPCYGTALLPARGEHGLDAARVANERMYALKYSLRPSVGALQSNEVLMEALAKRGPDCGDYLHGLAEIVEAVAAKLNVGFRELEQIRMAAELHDVGKRRYRPRSCRRPSRSIPRSGTSSSATR